MTKTFKSGVSFASAGIQEMATTRVQCFQDAFNYRRIATAYNHVEGGSPKCCSLHCCVLTGVVSHMIHDEMVRSLAPLLSDHSKHFQDIIIIITRESCFY